MNSDIPRTLAPFFQEYRFDQLDATRDADLVIARALAWGNRDELRWMFARYGRARVTDWMCRLGARRLFRRQFTAWKMILEIPETRVIHPPSGVWNH
ncbi:MAG: hypothetical protein HZC40_20870 [Chloroflexi bacterium]|nr:hypothetical protein [Chloroflexota bacterium]